MGNAAQARPILSQTRPMVTLRHRFVASLDRSPASPPRPLCLCVIPILSHHSFTISILLSTALSSTDWRRGRCPSQVARRASVLLYTSIPVEPTTALPISPGFSLSSRQGRRGVGRGGVLVHRMEEREMHTALGMCEPDALAPRHRARCANGSRLDRVSPRTDTRSITMAIRS